MVEKKTIFAKNRIISMSTHLIVYIVFGIVLSIALVVDLGLLSKKNQTVTIKQALIQTFFWGALALAFFVFLWFKGGLLAQENADKTVNATQLPLEFLSAYLMEWSLSIDNIFVFILIFNSFSVKAQHYSRVLLIGIMMAILFRIIFITLGVALVSKFAVVMYFFGVFLVYTGYTMFTADSGEQFDPHNSTIYKFLKKYLPLVNHDGNGKYVLRENGRPVYTTLFVVVILLAGIDLVFALDSIPAVMGISKDPMIIYTSNIFAVLGLRSLFFLLRGAVTKFDYLQQGIAIVLIVIGVKMLGEHYINEWIDKSTQVFISLGIILLCISGSILYSIVMNKKGTPEDIKDSSVN